MGPILERLLKFLVSLIGWPDWSDSAALRAWFQKSLAVLDKVADWTATQVDDLLVAGLAKCIANDDLWAALYAIIAYLLDLGADSDLDVVKSDGHTSEMVMQLADDAKLDPVTIVAIITAILKVIAWWKNHQVFVKSTTT